MSHENNNNYTNENSNKDYEKFEKMRENDDYMKHLYDYFGVTNEAENEKEKEFEYEDEEESKQGYRPEPEDEANLKPEPEHEPNFEPEPESEDKYVKKGDVPQKNIGLKRSNGSHLNGKEHIKAKDEDKRITYNQGSQNPFQGIELDDEKEIKSAPDTKIENKVPRPETGKQNEKDGDAVQVEQDTLKTTLVSPLPPQEQKGENENGRKQVFKNSYQKIKYTNELLLNRNVELSMKIKEDASSKQKLTEDVNISKETIRQKENENNLLRKFVKGELSPKEQTLLKEEVHLMEQGHRLDTTLPFEERMKQVNYGLLVEDARSKEVRKENWNHKKAVARALIKTTRDVIRHPINLNQRIKVPKDITAQEMKKGLKKEAQRDNGADKKRTSFIKKTISSLKKTVMHSNTVEKKEEGAKRGWSVVAARATSNIHSTVKKKFFNKFPSLSEKLTKKMAQAKKVFNKHLETSTEQSKNVTKQANKDDLSR